MYKVFADDTLVCDSRVEELALLDPVVQLEENKVGSFSFIIPPKHPYYDLIKRRKSVVRVIEDDELVFCGPCIDMGKDFYKQKEIYCEGELTYFNDSIQRPARFRNVTLISLLQAFVTSHNSQVEEKKHFQVGMVTVTSASGFVSYDTNMEHTIVYLKKLVDDLGGFFRIRYEDGIKYLDYLADSTNTNSQIIKLGQNLIDFKSNLSSADIATAIIPLGEKLEETTVEGVEIRQTIASVNDGIDYVFSPEAVENFGWIYKTVKWDDVTRPETLMTYGERYLSDIQFENIVIQAKAVDMHMADKAVERFKLSDQIRVLSAPHGMDRYFRLTKMTKYLNNPENNPITLGKNERLSLSTKSQQENAEIKKVIESFSPNNIVKEAVANATQIIKNAMNGYITMVLNEDGTPKELLIMDTNSTETATKVWRWNINGLGYSKTGYNGEYALAMTMDGAFVADFITTGILNAALIKAGILSDKAGANYFNLETGELKISASAKVGDSTVASKMDADKAAQNAANNAEANANAATDDKLKSYSTTTEMKSAISQSADAIKLEVSKTYATQAETQESINNLQQQIDGAIETFSGSEVPTLTNYPVTEWEDDTEKDTHVGDLYIVNANGGDCAGFYYRFEKNGTTYQWTLLKDSEVTKALQDAKEANEKAQAVEDNLKENYSTTVQMQSAIKQSAESINLEVSKKVGNDEIISKINQTAESVKISAERIDVDGVLDAEKIEALEIKSKHVEVVNADGRQTGKWDANGFMAQTDSYAETGRLPRYFENNYYNYPYYDTQSAQGNGTGQGDYVASYIIELGDITSEHTVYVKFKNPNADTAYAISNVGLINEDTIYEFTASNGRLVLTVSNWFNDTFYCQHIISGMGYTQKSILYGDVEKIWCPTAGIKKVSVSTGGGGSGAVTSVKYSYDNETIKTGIAGMEINTEDGTIKSDHYTIDEDGVNFQLDNYIGSDTLEDSRVNRFNVNKNGMYATAFEFDDENNMAEYKFMELLTSLYEAGFRFTSPHVEGAPECYFGVAGMENTAVYKTTTSSGSNVRIDSDGKFYRYASSSKRYKKDITTEIKEELNPEKLYDLEVVQYKYNDDYLKKNDQRYGKNFIGFIAEQVAEIYPLACNMDEQNRPEMWEIIILFPPLLKLVQEQKKQIDNLAERLEKLEERLGGENG